MDAINVSELKAKINADNSALKNLTMLPEVGTEVKVELNKSEEGKVMYRTFKTKKKSGGSDLTLYFVSIRVLTDSKTYRSELLVGVDLLDELSSVGSLGATIEKNSAGYKTIVLN